MASFNKTKFNLSSFEFPTALDVRFVVRSGAEGVEIREDGTPGQGWQYSTIRYGGTVAYGTPRFLLRNTVQWYGTPFL